MANALLLTALALPIALYWFLRSRSRLGNFASVAIAVASGWVLNLAWAFAAHESAVIAGALGWVCPTVLVALTWLGLRYAKRQAA